MVLAVIVLATLLFQANHGAVLPCSHLYAPACPPGHLYGGYVAAAYSRGCLCAAAHDHDHQPCSSYTDCGSCAGNTALFSYRRGRATCTLCGLTKRQVRLRLHPTGNGGSLYYQGSDLTTTLVDPEKDEPCQHTACFTHSEPLTGCWGRPVTCLNHWGGAKPTDLSLGRRSRAVT